MPNFFAVPHLRLARVKNLLDLLKQEVLSYTTTATYPKSVDWIIVDGQWCEAHKIKLANPVPDVMNSLATEICEGLRAVLDQISYASAEMAGNQHGKSTHFPISTKYEDLKKAQCKDVPTEIVDLFHTFKPYRDGNPWIWGLNEVAIGSKHRTLVPIGTAIGGQMIRHFQAHGMVVRMNMPPIWDESAGEVEICVTEPGVEIDYEIFIIIGLSIPSLAPFIRSEAVDCLSKMVEEVERVFKATENECVRLWPTWAAGKPINP